MLDFRFPPAMIFGNIRYFVLYPQDLSDNVSGRKPGYIGYIADALDIFVYYYKRKTGFIYYDLS